jgi:hypothetical protein
VVPVAGPTATGDHIVTESTAGPSSASDLGTIEEAEAPAKPSPAAEADRAEASLAAGNDRPPPRVWDRIEETLRREGRIT